MREIIIEVTKIEGKKKEDYVITGGIAGGKVVTAKNKTPELVLPIKALTFASSADTYSTNIWIENGETHIILPETKDHSITFVFLAL